MVTIRRNRRINAAFLDFKHELAGASAIFIKSWKILKRYPLSMIFFTFSALVWLIPHLVYGTAVVGGRYSAKLEALTGVADVLVFTGLGLVFIALFNQSMWGTAYSVYREQFYGTLENLYITPISRFSIILGNSLYTISQAAIGCTIQMILIGFWYKDAFNIWNLLLSTIFVFLAIIMVQGVSMLLVAFVHWQRQGWRVILLVQTIFMFLTPITFPIVVLPNYLQGIASLNPLTFAIEGFRDAFLFGYSATILRYLIILVILVPIILIVCVLAYRVMERWIRKKALIGQY